MKEPLLETIEKCIFSHASKSDLLSKSRTLTENIIIRTLEGDDVNDIKTDFPSGATISDLTLSKATVSVVIDSNHYTVPHIVIQYDLLHLDWDIGYAKYLWTPEGELLDEFFALK